MTSAERSEPRPRPPEVHYRLEVTINGDRVLSETMSGPMSPRTVATNLRTAADTVDEWVFADLRQQLTDLRRRLDG